WSPCDLTQLQSFELAECAPCGSAVYASAGQRDVAQWDWLSAVLPVLMEQAQRNFVRVNGVCGFKLVRPDLGHDDEPVLLPRARRGRGLTDVSCNVLRSEPELLHVEVVFGHATAFSACCFAIRRVTRSHMTVPRGSL